MVENLVQELQSLIGMPAIELVPHRKPMSFLDTLVAIGADFAVCEWVVGDDFALVEPGHGVPGYAGIEYMAQCIAVHSGARARIRGLPPPVGFLLGTRHFRCSVPYFETGIPYRAACRELVRDSQGMGSFACEILSGETGIAAANLAVLELPQEQEGEY